MTKTFIYGLLMVISFSINTAWSAETNDYNRTAVRNKWEDTDTPAQKNTEAKTKPKKVNKPRAPDGGLEKVNGEVVDIEHNEDIEALSDETNREHKKRISYKKCTSSKDCNAELGEDCAKRPGSSVGKCIPTWWGTQAPPTYK